MYLSITFALFTVDAKFNASVPFVDINVIPRQLYIHKDVEDCVGSGLPADEGTPQRIYLAINLTSGMLIAVEVASTVTEIMNHDGIS